MIRLETAAVMVYREDWSPGKPYPCRFARPGGYGAQSVYGLWLREDGWLVVEAYGDPGHWTLFPPHSILDVVARKTEIAGASPEDAEATEGTES